MPDGGGSRRRAERFTPFVYMACTFALVAFALPSVLRPPPDQATTSAEFSPDAPPEEDPQAIISSLQQASSGGAGNELATTTTTLPVEYKPVRGRCVGNPPRQIESVYGPPCKEAFVGDNGGETHQGVTRDEIRIAVSMALTGETDYDECVPDGPPPPEESANERTYRVLQEYFNTRYEFSGRKIRFCHVEGEDGETDGDTNQRIQAQKADERDKVFGAIHETSPASAFEFARRGIVTFTLAQFPGEVYQQYQPYLWNFGPDQTRLIDMGAEYLCKKLAGKPPIWSPQYRDTATVRKFGLVSYNDSGYTGGPDYMQQLIRERCGVELGANVVRYDLSAGADPTVAMSSAMTQFAADDVTTIIYMGDLISAAVFTPAATQNLYFPEWYMPGFGGVDVDDFLARSAYDQQQWENAFGFSAYEIPVADPARECEIAYRSIDPDNSPDDGMCTYMWQQMVKMFGAIQEAGPNLTPETFRDALFRLPHDPPNPNWRMAGGYGPNDFTYVDWYVELWWEPDAIHPNGDQGAYCYARGGKRYTYGQFAVEDPPVFNPADCMTTRPAA